MAYPQDYQGMMMMGTGWSPPKKVKDIFLYYYFSNIYIDLDQLETDWEKDNLMV